MTVQSTLARVAYTISGAGPYTIPYYFLDNADIIVIRTPAGGGDPITLVLTTDYTLAGAGVESGGTLTLVAPVNGDTLIIINEPEPTQLVSYPETGKFPAKSHETALDRLTMVVKRVYDLASRGLRLNDGDAATSFVFPISSPGKLIGWGTDGKLTNTSASGVGPNSIGSAEIIDGAVGTAELADAAVTNTKLANGSITASKLAADVFTTLWAIGDIFISTSPTNPAGRFGGTWAAFGTGRTLVGIDTGQAEFNVVEETGGAKTHTLTTAEIPSHTHTNTIYDTAGTGGGIAKNGSGTAPVSLASDATGGGGAHNNLQPYIVVYFWKRTA